MGPKETLKRPAAAAGKFAMRVQKSILAKRPAAAEVEDEEEDEGDVEDEDEETDDEDEDEDTDDEEVTVSKKTMKRPAAASADKPAKKGKKESAKAAEEKLISERT